MPSKTVQIEVPAELLEQLQVFMNAMNIQSQEPAQVDQEPAQDDQETIPEDMEDDDIEVTYQEVKAIVGHQKHPTEEHWNWKIQWSDGTESWVNDSDCDCEETIRAYMEEKELGNTAYIVCRVSTKEQASSTSLSLEAQLSEIQSGVTLQSGIRTGKFTRIKVCSFAKSAYKNIPDSIRMIGESCRSGDMIFVWRVDRLTRNIEDHLSFIQEINAKNVDIYSHSEGFSYNSDRLRFIQAIVDATKEAELLGKRVRLANNRKRQRGDERIGSLPYGKKYKFDTERGCNVVVDHDEELQLIAQIKAWKNTKSLAEIHEHLSNLGILKRGRAWSVNMIRNVR